MPLRRGATPAPHARSWRPSLQIYLAGVVLTVAIVVGLVTYSAGSRTVEQATERTTAAVQFRATLAAKDIDEAIELTMATVQEIATGPGRDALFASAGTADCPLAFSGAGPFSSGHTDAVDLDGRVVCSSGAQPAGAGTPLYAGAEWLGATGVDAVVTQPLEDRATGKRALAVVAPVAGLGAVVTFLDLDVLAAGLSERLSGNIDAEFALVAPESDAIPLAPASSDLIQATAPIASLGWDVRAWGPRGAGVLAAEAFNERMAWLLLGATVFLLVALELLSLVIARPIRRLTATVRGVLAGDPVTDVPASGPAEVVSLAEDFARLIRAVERERAQRVRAEELRAGAEADREAQARMLNSIVNSTQSLIYVKDLEGRYLMVNASFERVVGKLRADILGHTAASISPELADRWDAGDRRARAGTITEQEYGDAPDGRHFFDTVKFPLHDAQGVLYATCGVSLDVTSRHLVTEATAKARDAALAATAAKSMFLAAMSHEIRTPMTAVIGMTDLLSQTQLDDYQRELIDTVQSSGDALLGVINNILDLSKIESGELNLEEAPFDLRAELERCLDLVAAASAAKHLDVVCHVDASCPAQVVGDGNRVRQIVTNLLANAVKFTETGQVLLEVTTGHAAEGRLTVTVTVTDSGIGISSAGLDKLFTSFSQVDASTTRVYGGTGLGLTIARRLAEAMDGNVVVTSTPGVGSAFAASMVLAVAPQTAAADPTAVDSVLVGRRVLVVDDNPTSLRVLGLQQSALGVECTLAATAADAVALFQQAPRYDLVLTDMVMPGTDGIALARSLAQLSEAQLSGAQVSGAQVSGAQVSGAQVSGAQPLPPMVLMNDLGLRPAEANGYFAAVLAKPVKAGALRCLLTSVLRGDAVERQPSPPGATHRNGDAAALRILVAEDHPVNQRVIQLMLKDLGHSVDTVGDGESAVRAVAARPYDVVLMDVHMPQLDGLEATRRIRAQSNPGGQPRIVAMTASALLDDKNACASAGMDAYLSKPVRATELDAMLQLTARHHHGAAVPASSTTIPAEQLLAGSGPTRVPPHTAAAQVSPDRAAVDLAVLNKVVGALDADGNGLRDALIGDYLREGTLLVTRISVAAGLGDNDGLVAAAHTLRSPSSLLGAVVLSELLFGAEHGSPDRTAAELSGIAADIEGEYAAVEALLSSVTTAAMSTAPNAYSS